MAKVVPDDQNRFRRTWRNAQDQGITRKALAESLDIDRGRLNDLIIGRARPRLAEMAALTGKRRSTLVRYYDEAGARHSFYTGRGMSLERLVESGGAVEIAGEMSLYHHYDQPDEIIALENRFPKQPAHTRIYSTNPTLRRELDVWQDARRR